MKNFDAKDKKLKRLLEIKQCYSETEETNYMRSLTPLIMFFEEDQVSIPTLVYDKFREGINIRK